MVALLAAEHTPRLFAPVIDTERFLHRLRSRPDFGLECYRVAQRGGEIVGVCARWDTQSFKRTRVLRYGGRLQAVRIAYGALAPLMGFPRLPAPSEPLRELTIAEYAVRQRDPEIMAALLEAIYAEAWSERYNTVIFASVAGDPLLAAAQAFSVEVVRSDVMAFARRPELLEPSRTDMALPYVDVALL
jgi:hypothetical protein